MVSDVEPEPAVMVRPDVDASKPEPVIVPLPEVARVMPPLAVVAPLTEMLLPLLVVTESDPAPSALASSCMPPV